VRQTSGMAHFSCESQPRLPTMSRGYPTNRHGPRPAASSAEALSTDETLVQLERCATELEKLQRTHHSATLGAVANETLTADAAIIRVDALRSLQALAWHARRSTVHLVGPDQ
jgi:phosphate:Na+ symporter